MAVCVIFPDGVAMEGLVLRLPGGAAFMLQQWSSSVFIMEALCGLCSTKNSQKCVFLCTESGGLASLLAFIHFLKLHDRIHGPEGHETHPARKLIVSNQVRKNKERHQF